MEQSPSPPLKFGWAIKGRQGKLVQKMKAHASEYAQHPALCGQVIKKDARCSKDADQHVSIRSKINLRARVQGGVSGLRQAAANFSFFMHQYGRSFLYTH